MTDGKLQSIQALRGIAILLVLGRHMQVMETKYGGDHWLPHLFRTGDSGVDIFFVISGFIMVLISRDQFQKPGSIGTFLTRRAFRIYPLYWIYSLVILGVFLLSPSLVPAMQSNQVDLLASFLLLPQFPPPLLGQGWTLGYEVCFYLIFSIALLLPEKRLIWFLLGWALAVSIGYNFHVNVEALSNSATVKTLANPITIEFVLGGCAALTVRRIPWSGGWLSLGMGGLLLAATSFFIDPLETSGLRLFCYGLPALLILYGAVSLEKHAGYEFPQWLRTLGDASYSIYLSHILVISAVGRLWAFVHQPGPWDNVAALAIMGAAALGWGLISYRYVEQPLLRTLRNWQPRRKTAPVPPTASVVSE